MEPGRPTPPRLVPSPWAHLGPNRGGPETRSRCCCRPARTDVDRRDQPTPRASCEPARLRFAAAAANADHGALRQSAWAGKPRFQGFLRSRPLSRILRLRRLRLPNFGSTIRFRLGRRVLTRSPLLEPPGGRGAAGGGSRRAASRTEWTYLSRPAGRNGRRRSGRPCGPNSSLAGRSCGSGSRRAHAPSRRP